MDNQPLTQCRPSAFQKPLPTSNNVQMPMLSNIGITPQVMQVINSQNILIMRLLEQQNELYQKLSTNRSSGSDSGGNQADKKKMQFKTSAGYTVLSKPKASSSSNPEENQQFLVPISIIQKHPTFKKKYHFQQNRQFQDESEDFSELEADGEQSAANFERTTEKKKQTQTKNMIKNFSKAIFNYIRKNRLKVKAILKQLQIGEKQFMRKVQNVRGHVHSIAQLRSLWVPQNNKFHKAFRIISHIYLQRHCMEKTFNSRIENYQIHLKYRQRLLQAIAHPEQFTILKLN